MQTYLITGATDFVGGHVAQTLIERGDRICTVVEPQTDAESLERIGIEIQRGTLHDVGLLRGLIADVDGIIHCAELVEDFAPASEYQRANVDATRCLLEASKGQALSRFVHLSSCEVYALGNHSATDESAALPARGKGYSQSKRQAEKLAQQYYRDFGVPVVILRPGYVYGSRERRWLPTLIQEIRDGTFYFIGGSQQALCTLYIENLLLAIMLALEVGVAVGQIYNINDGELVSKAQFTTAIADALDIPPPFKSAPLWQARLTTWLGGKRSALTESKLRFLGYHLDFSIAKAQMEIGYHPRFSFADGMYQTMKWFKEHDSQSETVMGAYP